MANKKPGKGRTPPYIEVTVRVPRTAIDQILDGADLEPKNQDKFNAMLASLAFRKRLAADLLTVWINENEYGDSDLDETARALFGDRMLQETEELREDRQPLDPRAMD